MLSFTIRKARLSDIEKILNLQEKLIKYHSKIDEYYRTNKESGEKFNKYYISILHKKDNVLLVALSGKKIIGFLSASIKKKSPHYSIENVGNIDETFVLEEYRKNGVAKKLFEVVLKWFKRKKLNFIEVEADSRNKSSVDVWEALGFEEYTKRFKIKI